MDTQNILNVINGLALRKVFKVMAQCDIKGVIAFQKLLYVMHCKKGDFNA